MKVKILKSVNGQDTNENGIACPEKMYMEGEEYEVSEDLAKNLVAGGFGEVVKKAAPKPAPAKPVADKTTGAPETKAAGK